MIRILHIIDSLDLGGGQTVLLNLLQFADRSRFHIEVASLHGQNNIFHEAFEKLGVPVHILSPRRWMPHYLIRLVRLLKHGRFHIVHCHLNASNWIAKPLAAACGVPVRICHDHCNDVVRSKNPAVILLDTFANRFSSLILAVSTSTRDFLISREHIDPSRIILFPNAVDTDYFQPPDAAARIAAREQLGFEPGCFLVAGVGRLVPQKNYSAFLSAFATFNRQRPYSCFLIAGTGPEEARLRQFAVDLGIAKEGRFLGFCHDTQQLYRACDVLLLPSLYEGLPLVALEAMASGVPVVASSVDGLRDLIQTGENGLLAPSHRPAEFAELLLHLHDSRSEYERISQAARNTIQTHYDARTLTKQLEQLYLKLS